MGKRKRGLDPHVALRRWLDREHSALGSCHCPRCSKEFTAATSVGPDDARPKPGDPTICFGCGELLVFGADLAPREPTADELAAFRVSESWPEIQRARRGVLLLIAQRGGMSG